MSSDLYIPLTELQFSLHKHMRIIYYCENAHLLRHRCEHISGSASNYHIDSRMNAMHYKAKHTIKLKPDPTILDSGDLILPLESLKTVDTCLCTRNRPTSLEYSAYRVINGTKFWECSFAARPYYLTQNMLSCKNNAAAATVNLISTTTCLTNFFLIVDVSHSV